MNKAKAKKETRRVFIDKKTGRKKVVGKPHPPKQGYHGTNSEKNLNPEE